MGKAIMSTLVPQTRRGPHPLPFGGPSQALRETVKRVTSYLSLSTMFIGTPRGPRAPGAGGRYVLWSGGCGRPPGRCRNPPPRGAAYPQADPHALFRCQPCKPRAGLAPFFRSQLGQPHRPFLQHRSTDLGVSTPGVAGVVQIGMLIPQIV